MNKEKGILYLVATPIGNLDDITYRAVKVLNDVDVIAAEDTRHTLKLLNHLEISKPLISYHRHNEDVKKELLIDKLNSGENIALVTDAGTPAISDPGEEVVKSAIENNIKIIPIPGACALINALICSGMDTKEFVFYGFLPINKKLRKNKFDEIKEESKTIIIYEAPHKIGNTLKDILEELGDVNIVLAREITKIHEEFIRGKVSEIIGNVEQLKGEMIIIIEGNKNIEKSDDIIQLLNNMSLEEHYEFYKNKKIEKKEIIKKIAKDRNVNKNDIYQKFINY
jgi:16S rRNA (cytidine1402-2'-O)-methyltransferase